MKALCIKVVAGLCISAMMPASAAKFDVNPLGELTMPIDNRCEMSVSMSNIDYGVNSRGQLQDVAGQKVSFGKRSLTMSIVCPYSQLMRVVLRGSQRTGDDQLQFGDRGGMSLRVLNAELDGQSTELTSINAEGTLKGASSDNLYLRPDFGMMATRNGQAIQGKSFTARLEVEPVMAEKEARVSAPKVSEANFSLELIN